MSTQTFEEWRATGNPGGGYPPYEFTWSPMLNPHLGDPERGARAFAAAMSDKWDDGPHLRRRTVTVTGWENVDRG